MDLFASAAGMSSFLDVLNLLKVVEDVRYP